MNDFYQRNKLWVEIEDPLMGPQSQVTWVPAGHWKVGSKMCNHTSVDLRRDSTSRPVVSKNRWGKFPHAANITSRYISLTEDKQHEKINSRHMWKVLKIQGKGNGIFTIQESMLKSRGGHTLLFGPDGKHWRLCRLYCFCCNYPVLQRGTKATTDKTKMGGSGCVPIKFYLQRQTVVQTWPMGCSLPTYALKRRKLGI